MRSLYEIALNDSEDVDNLEIVTDEKKYLQKNEDDNLHSTFEGDGSNRFMQDKDLMIKFGQEKNIEDDKKKNQRIDESEEDYKTTIEKEVELEKNIRSIGNVKEKMEKDIEKQTRIANEEEKIRFTDIKQDWTDKPTVEEKDDITEREETCKLLENEEKIEFSFVEDAPILFSGIPLLNKSSHPPLDIGLPHKKNIIVPYYDYT